MNMRGQQKHWRNWSLLAMLAVAGCRGGGVTPNVPTLPNTPDAPAAEPVVAVQAMAQRLVNDDLIGYARLAVPPAQYLRLQQAWSEGHSNWPLTDLPLDDQLLPLLAALRTPDASTRLQRSFDRQLAGQANAMRQAAQSIGTFGVQYLRHQPGYTSSQKTHYTQLIQTLTTWAQSAPLSDRVRARDSLNALVDAATKVGFDDETSLHARGMEDSLRELAPFLRTGKAVLAGYGLEVDTALRNLHGELLSQQGDNALLRLQYPLAGQTLSVQVPLSRRDGHWYLTRTLADTDVLLRQADAARATAASVPGGARPASARP